MPNPSWITVSILQKRSVYCTLLHEVALLLTVTNSQIESSYLSGDVYHCHALFNHGQCMQMSTAGNYFCLISDAAKSHLPHSYIQSSHQHGSHIVQFQIDVTVGHQDYIKVEIITILQKFGVSPYSSFHTL